MDEGHVNRFQRGDTIYLTDDRAHSIYLIAEGRVRIVHTGEDGNESVKAILGKGEMFGEMALLGEPRRRDRAEAVENGTTLCSVSIEQMKELMQDDQNLTFGIHKMIGLRMIKLERRIESLVFKDVKTRLVDFILDLIEEKGEKKMAHYQVKHPYTHRDIGNLIGASRQTVTTLLSELKDDYIVLSERKKWIVPDLDKLKNLKSQK